MENLNRKVRPTKYYSSGTYFPLFMKKFPPGRTKGKQIKKIKDRKQRKVHAMDDIAMNKRRRNFWGREV